MADFCKQCSEENFDEDFNDLAGLCDEDQIVDVLCEGCGRTFVDPTGKCVAKCLKNHRDIKPGV